MTRRISTGIALILLAAAASATRGDTPVTRRPLDNTAAREGKVLYVRECSACHGERGDGKGPAADFTDPRPRNFTKRLFKLRSTESGQPPATSDILKTIEHGIPGSAMPSFAFLGEDERKAIAAYVLKLADMLEEPEIGRAHV